MPSEILSRPDQRGFVPPSSTHTHTQTDTDPAIPSTCDFAKGNRRPAHPTNYLSAEEAPCDTPHFARFALMPANMAGTHLQEQEAGRLRSTLSTRRDVTSHPFSARTSWRKPNCTSASYNLVSPIYSGSAAALCTVPPENHEYQTTAYAPN